MPGKKWCEYCRINLSYNKKEIQEHEETRMHLQNKQKAIKYERIKIQQDEKKQRQENKQSALLSSANIPKAKKGSALERQVQDYRQGVFASGRAAIAQLIAEKTQGKFGAPIAFPEKEDLLLAENFRKNKDNEEANDESQSQEFDMWKLDICQQTGDLCFINNLTKAKYYEPPKGFIMTDKQKEQWEYLQQICKQKVNENADNIVQISEWQEVPVQQDYFKMNEIVEEQEEHQKNEDNKLKRPYSSLQDYQVKKQEDVMEQTIQQKTWKQELEEKINNNSIDANEVMGTVIAHQLKMCKNMKEKNDTLKTLIKGDIQIRQTAEEFNKRETFEQTDAKPIGFKPKKKIKTVKLTEEDDIY